MLVWRLSDRGLAVLPPLLELFSYAAITGMMLSHSWKIWQQNRHLFRVTIPPSAATSSSRSRSSTSRTSPAGVSAVAFLSACFLDEPKGYMVEVDEQGNTQRIAVE